MALTISKYKPQLTDIRPYYFLSIINIVGIVFGYYLNVPYSFLFIVYGLIPLIEQKTTQDWTNPSLRQMKELQAMTKFKLVLYITVILQWITYYFIHSHIWEMTLFKGIGFASFGIVMFGASFMLSHQLIHKGFIDKIFGTLDQIKSYYGHFTIEHVYGHHKKVATPDDPASAPKGMTVYEFLPKSIIGSYKSSFKIQPLITILFTVSYFLFMALIYHKFNLRGLILSWILGLGALLMLQVINYVQHYGLKRKKLQDGTYQKVTIRHSWNSPHRLSNYLLFKLQRHSDHHQNAMKPYQSLCSYEDSPQLPSGYAVCVLLALFPKTWFDAIDPLVDQYNKNTHQKGSQLIQLKKSQIKTKIFTRKVAKVTGYIAGAQILFKIIELLWYIAI